MRARSSSGFQNWSWTGSIEAESPMRGCRRASSPRHLVSLREELDMKDESFAELVTSVRQAGRIRRGDRKTSRRRANDNGEPVRLGQRSVRKTSEAARRRRGRRSRTR